VTAETRRFKMTFNGNGTSKYKTSISRNPFFVYIFKEGAYCFKAVN